MELADLEKLSQGLIEKVDGLVTEKNINGVVEVLRGVAQGIHDNWEQHLANETNDVLMQDNTCCPICTSLIQVVRRRTIIDVDTQ